jgi:tetratricopeptide (TPR) repeat protein
MARPVSDKSSLWVYNPALDLIVGCGAWSAPLLLLGYLAANSSVAVWSVTFYAVALLFNYPHYMATIYRAYHTQEDFNKYRVFTVHITALVFATLVLSHFFHQALPWIFTLYLCWSPWHYSGQNYGLFMMFARRAGAKPSTNVRQALYAAFLLSYAILMINFQTGASNDPLFLSLGIPAAAGRAAVLILGVGFVGFSVFGLAGLAREIGWKPLIPSLTLFSTQFLWFLLPTALALAKGLQIPQSRYSTGVLAVMHSAQYIWITSYYARREANNDRQSNWRPVAYFGVLIAGGIALFIPGPWLASRIFHFDFAASFLIFTALVNIHHFILDGAIWKLRDGRIAAFLLNSQERLSQSASRTQEGVLSGLRWLFGDSKRAHTIRVAAAVALLALAGVDQIRYYFRIHAENLADLQLAAKLNSFDSGLQAWMGRRKLESGESDAAVQSLQAALRLNPADSSARDSLLAFLLQQKRFDEAYRLTQQSLRYSPNDVNLLVNNGMLAVQAGKRDEAITNWKRAIALDSSQWLPRLYLAGELQKMDRCSEAIPQYVGFLDQLRHVNTVQRPPSGSVLSALFGLGTCQEKVNNPAAAEKAYQAGRSFADQTSDQAGQSLADIYQAQLLFHQHRGNEALPLYQSALRLDKGLNDPQVEAQDWYTYGIFLRDSSFPARLSYACLMKSEQLMRPLNLEGNLRLISDARQGLKNVGPPVTPQNLDAVLEQALQLKAK